MKIDFTTAAEAALLGIAKRSGESYVDILAALHTAKASEFDSVPVFAIVGGACRVHHLKVRKARLEIIAVREPGKNPCIVAFAHANVKRLSRHKKRDLAVEALHAVGASVSHVQIL